MDALLFYREKDPAVYIITRRNPANCGDVSAAHLYLFFDADIFCSAVIVWLIYF